MPLFALAFLVAQAEIPPGISDEPPSPPPPEAEGGAPADDGAAPLPAATRIAVYDLELSGVDPRVGGVVTESLLVELRKLQRVSVIGMAEVRAMLDMESQRAMAGCDEESCLADLAGALGADVLIVGGLARVGDEHVLSLKRIEQKEARVKQSVARRLKAEDGEEFLAAVGPVIEELFPEWPLRPGATRGVDETQALKLNPPPLPPWAFWTAAAVSGVAGGAVVAAAASWAVTQVDYSLYAFSSTEAPIDGAVLSGKRNLVLGTAALAWAFAAVTAGAAIVAGVTIPFTDWEGYGDALDDGAPSAGQAAPQVAAAGGAR